MCKKNAKSNTWKMSFKIVWHRLIKTASMSLLRGTWLCSLAFSKVPFCVSAQVLVDEELKIDSCFCVDANLFKLTIV